jgi:hypothetical protein
MKEYIDFQPRGEAVLNIPRLPKNPDKRRPLQSVSFLPQIDYIMFHKINEFGAFFSKVDGAWQANFDQNLSRRMRTEDTERHSKWIYAISEAEAYLLSQGVLVRRIRYDV